MPRTILTFAPRNAEEAAGIFRAVSAAAEAGRKIRAGILESPFRPAAGVDLPAAHSSIDEIVRSADAEETLVLLSHAAMDRIHEVSAKDFLAVVGGGVRFGELVDAVGKAGLYFPHEHGAATRDATVAGIIMAGATFRTEGRYGRLREYLLSLELATPSGEVIRTGSRSVKDVTGYDLTGFLIGQGGVCGMIAKVTIRLLPAPGTRIRFVCEGTRSALESLVGEIRRKLSPAFLEMLSEGRLVGELQSAVRGKEEALLGSLSALAPEGVRFTKLDSTAPISAPDGCSGPLATADGDPTTEELNRRLLRVFDPQGIMLP
jgi:FAD/FMN-containing dehydrogenase